MQSLPAQTALIVIDIQHAIDHPRWAAEGPRNNPDAERRVAGLLAAWRTREMPIVHIRHDLANPGSSYAPGQPGNAFKPDTAPLMGERIIAKRINSAFIGTDLEHWLKSQGFDTLVVTGVITNNSVEATVRMAGNLGFTTYLVEDGCFTFAKRDHAGKLRSAEEVHAMSLANLNGEYCTVTTAAEILGALP